MTAPDLAALVRELVDAGTAFAFAPTADNRARLDAARAAYDGRDAGDEGPEDRAVCLDVTGRGRRYLRSGTRGHAVWTFDAAGAAPYTAAGAARAIALIGVPGARVVPRPDPV